MSLLHGLALFPSVLIIVAGWAISVWLFRQGLALIGALVAIGPPVLVYAFLSFDEVVKFAYRNHHDVWVHEGKPSGFYWRNRECNWWGSGFAFQRLSMAWLFHTPDWAKKPSPANIWLTRLRICVATWNAFVLIGLAYVFLASR